MIKNEAQNIIFNHSVTLVEGYLRLNQPVLKSDLIIGLGSRVDLTAIRASNLYLEEISPRILFTGKGNNHDLTEAEAFRNIALSIGVPKEKILLEKESTNTYENVKNSKKVLLDQNCTPSIVTLVCVPYHERRTLATFEKQWPEVLFRVTSPNISLASYFNYTKQAPRIAIKTLKREMEKLTNYSNKGDINCHSNSPIVLLTYFRLLEAFLDKD